MDERAPKLWKLDELTAEVALALSGDDYQGPDNGQVRAIPDRRTIRYYGTLGLLDRPAEMRGRTAYYGRRHLLQLVAIKRLQTHGLALKDIQERLQGLPNRRLEDIAHVPGEVGELAGPAPEPPAGPGRRQQAFWAQLPAAGPPPEEAPAAVDTPAAAAGGPARTTFSGIPVTDELTLLLPLRRELDEDDWQAVRSAAQPLLKLLRARRLLGGGASPTRMEKEGPDGRSRQKT